MITDSGITELSNLIAGDINARPMTLALGSDDTPVTASDTALGSEQGRLSIASSYVDLGEAIVITVIEENELNGFTIREYGLLSGNGVLIARKIPDNFIFKNRSVTLDTDWKISLNPSDS